MNIFTLDPAVKKLLGWKISDEEEKWALKAIESLVKKMRKRNPDDIHILEYALAHPGSRTKCVTIPRSLDGRLQVSHRKALPHVIYCRVWRWPNLQSHHELKPTPDCQFPYNGRNEQICINPYHYQRVESAAVKPSLHQQISLPLNFFSLQPSTSLPFQSRGAHIAPAGFLLSPKNGANNVASSSSEHLSTAYLTPPASAPLPPSLIPSQQQFPFSSPFQQAHPHPKLSYSQSVSSPSASSPSISQSPSAISDDDEFRQLLPVQFGINGCGNGTVSLNVVGPAKTPCWATRLDGIEYWCSVCYYELNTRVGEPFKMNKKSVVIDGFTAPFSENETEERICLGLLSNVNRNATIDNTRKHIGRGIKINCTDLQVTLFNASNSAIFIQSRNANFKFNLQSTAVCRVPPQATMLIFDFQLFKGVLERAKTDGFCHVYELQKMCFVRLSFVKGWGADYHRKDITSTPCWLELQLNHPLTWIDGVLSRLEPPQHMDVTSVS